MGLRERKKIRTRQELADAALALFTERGFEATTVEEIVAAVDVSPRTFFRYFASKEDALLVDDEALRDQLLEALAGRPAGEPVLTAVHRAVMSLTSQYEAKRERLFRIYRLCAQSPSLADRQVELQLAWVEGLAQQVGGRLGRDPASDLEARLVARVALSCLHAAADVWFATDGKADLPALVDRAFSEVGAGLDALSGGG